MLQFFIDTETTGTSSAKHGVIQISGIVVVNDEFKESFDKYTRPLPNDEIDQKALEIHGLPKEEIKQFADPYKIKQQFLSMMDRYINKYEKTQKFFFMGYQSDFDYQFLRSWFNKMGDKYFGSYFHFPSINVAQTVAMNFPEAWAKLPDKKLQTVLRHFLPDVAEGLNFHEAFSDIKGTYELWKMCNRPG